jgi:O-acetyl-ADP-ribose deacetylase (regulator of RNase III)
MIIFLDNSNILDVKEGIILQGCNAQGVMGSGVAKQLRARYPVVYTDYLEHVQFYNSTEEKLLGTTCVSHVAKALWVYNGITQEYYGKDGKQYIDYDAITSVVARAVIDGKAMLKDVHIPYMIGAGLGGGDLTKIKTIIEDISTFYGKNIYCHIYRQ